MCSLSPIYIWRASKQKQNGIWFILPAGWRSVCAEDLLRKTSMEGGGEINRCRLTDLSSTSTLPLFHSVTGVLLEENMNSDTCIWIGPKFHRKKSQVGQQTSHLWRFSVIQVKVLRSLKSYTTLRDLTPLNVYVVQRLIICPHHDTSASDIRKQHLDPTACFTRQAAKNEWLFSGAIS